MLLLLTVMTLMATVNIGADAFNIKGEPVYFLFTDRFQNGSTQNDYQTWDDSQVSTGGTESFRCCRWRY